MQLSTKITLDKLGLLLYLTWRKRLVLKKTYLINPQLCKKNALLASYIVSAEIAKAKKSFTDGEFVKNAV